VVMNTGRIEQIGTPNEVCEEPATPFVLEFLQGHERRQESEFRSQESGAPYELTRVKR
jgi:sulfate transport system ATP-binding protein